MPLPAVPFTLPLLPPSRPAGPPSRPLALPSRALPPLLPPPPVLPLAPGLGEGAVPVMLEPAPAAGELGADVLAAELLAPPPEGPLVPVVLAGAGPPEAGEEGAEELVVFAGVEEDEDEGAAEGPAGEAEDGEGLADGTELGLGLGLGIELGLGLGLLCMGLSWLLSVGDAPCWPAGPVVHWGGGGEGLGMCAEVGLVEGPPWGELCSRALLC